MNGVVQLCGIADHDPAVAEEIGDGFVASFRNQVSGVLLDLGAFEEGRDGGMLLEAFEQAVWRFSRALEIGDEAADARVVLNLLDQIQERLDLMAQIFCDSRSPIL